MNNKEYDNNNRVGKIKFFLASLVGVLLFFEPVIIKGNTTILIDAVITSILDFVGTRVKWFILAAAVWGMVDGIRQRQYNEGPMQLFFFISRCTGVLLGIAYICGIGPSLIFDKRILPFLFDNICRSIIFLVPIGGMALVFLTEYGLMEFVGAFLEGFMKKLWKIPGIAAVDILTSFVGSFSLGFILTDKMYTKGKYSAKQSVIIATGFSTVSTTFMITLCRTLGLMNVWGLFFIMAFFCNMIVTFVVIRLWPISIYPEFENRDEGEKTITKSALLAAAEKANAAEPLPNSLRNGFISGINMLGIMIPTILSIGTLGMILVLYTPAFDALGYVLYPVVWTFYPDEAIIISKALSTTIIDTFLPVSFISDYSDQCRFFCGLVIVCEILFMTASIPSLLATHIPVKGKDLLVIWLERIVVSIIVAGLLSKLICIVL